VGEKDGCESEQRGGGGLGHEATDTAIRIRKWNAEWSRHTRKTAERQGWEDTSRERRGARIVSLDHIFPDI
jgi:hypothetical protein